MPRPAPAEKRRRNQHRWQTSVFNSAFGAIRTTPIDARHPTHMAPSASNFQEMNSDCFSQHVSNSEEATSSVELEFLHAHITKQDSEISQVEEQVSETAGDTTLGTGTAHSPNSGVLYDQSAPISSAQSTALRNPPQIIRVSSDDARLGPDASAFWRGVEREVVENMARLQSNEFRASIAQKLRTELPSFLHITSRTSPDTKFVKLPEWSTSTVWIIGDLHGDLLSLNALIRYVLQMESSVTAGQSPSRIVFLGDLVDDGPRDAELIAQFFEFITAAPESIIYLQGNHDIGISFDKTTGVFRSSVSPSDFCDRLNDMEPGCAMHDLACAAVEFFQQAPAALLLPDGLLIAHGGVPHTDLQQHIISADDLNRPEMVTDFVWTRLHESARRKIPNRTTRGCSLGFEDFDAFCDRVKPIIGQEITGMVRGHDHVPERILVHERYRRRPVVTINSMCRKQRGDVLGPYARKPAVACWRNGHFLEVHQLEIPEDLIMRVYPPTISQVASTDEIASS